MTSVGRHAFYDNRYLQFKMKYTLVIISCFFAACQFDKAGESNIILKQIVGEWDLDSIPNRRTLNESLLILENYDVYKFSRFNGGKLSKLGRLNSNDSIYSEYGANLKAQLIRPNKLRLHGGGWYKIDEFYIKEDSGNVLATYENYRKKDSVRTQIMGWWKTVGNYNPIRLSNHNAKPTRFTLNIKHNGEADIYINNKLDSIANYTYHTNLDGMDLNRADVVGWESKISFNKNGIMNMKLGKRNLDTIKLIRITEIE